MNEALKAIFEGQDFSQEFKDKVSAIFESSVEEQVSTIKEEIEQKYEKLAEDYSEYVVSEMEDLTEKYVESEVMPMVEKYLDYSVQEFMTENKLAVESGTKVELAEQFLTGLTGIAESFNVQVPEGQDDYISEMENKLQASQRRFDKVLDENQQLKQEIQIDEMADVVDTKVVGLTESQKEKFFKVAERVRFQDKEQYANAIDELYESYFPTEGSKEKEQLGESNRQQLDESNQEPATGSKWEEQLFSKLFH